MSGFFSNFLRLIIGDRCCPKCHASRTLHYRGFYLAGDFVATRAACVACGERFDTDPGTNLIIGPLGTLDQLKKERAQRDQELFGE